MENAGTRQNERDFYNEMIRRAKRVRERAADSLKRTRQARKRVTDARTRKSPRRK